MRRSSPMPEGPRLRIVGGVVERVVDPRFVKRSTRSLPARSSRDELALPDLIQLENPPPLYPISRNIDPRGVIERSNRNSARTNYLVPPKEIFMPQSSATHHPDDDESLQTELVKGKQEDRFSTRKKKASKKESFDFYDQYTLAESTSGHSMFSDKYRVSKASIATTVSKASHSEQRQEQSDGQHMGTKLGNGQFTMPGGAVAARAVTQPELKDTREVELVAESCPQDFIETMFPLPLTVEDQKTINENMEAMTRASNHSVKNASCGASLAIDDEEEDEDVELVIKKDWYDKTVPLAKNGFFSDMIHTLWACQ